MNASINFELRENKISATGEAPLYLRITYDRKPSWMSLGINLNPKDWNKERQEVRRSHHRYKILNDQILNVKSKAQDAILELKEIDKLNSKRVINRVKGNDSRDFLTYAKGYIESTFESGSVRKAKNTKVLVNKVKHFSGTDSLSMSEIDNEFLSSFEVFLKKEYENKANTIRKNFQFFSQVLKKAVDDGYLSQNPLDGYKLPNYQKPKKEALSFDQIKKIEGIELTKGSSMWHTRNYFLFSFYNAGIRFGDLCLLKKKNIKAGRLQYLMSKTITNSEPKWKNIKLNTKSIEILELYDYEKKDDEEYLFPILDLSKNVDDPLVFDREKQSKNAIANKDLKKIAKKAGIDQTVSTHIARHSFANYALKQGTSLYSISKALAHSDLKTTESYLKSFDEELLDDEMEKLFGS